jgi:hypothetical protein
LLFDCKIIGLEKSSQMALDIERMAAQADAAVGAAGAAETVSVEDLGRRDGELGHGEQAGRGPAMVDAQTLATEQHGGGPVGEGGETYEGVAIKI